MINSQNMSIQKSSDSRDSGDNPPQYPSLLQQHNFITAQQNLNVGNSNNNNNNNGSNNPNSNIPNSNIPNPNINNSPSAQNTMLAQPILYDENGNNPNPYYFQFLYGHDKWPQNVERAFTAALKLIVKSGTSKTKMRNKNYGRNELISLYIRYHTGEIRTKKQISSHIQVLKKSILSKKPTDLKLTPLDNEVLDLIENGAEQNEKSLNLFYTVFDEIIDSMTNDKNYQKFKNTITDTTRNNNINTNSPNTNNIVNNISPNTRNNTNSNASSPTDTSGNALLYQQRQPQQLIQMQGQPMMVQEQNFNGTPTYSIIQNVPMLLVQDNKQSNILRPVNYADGSPPMLARGQQQRSEWGLNTNNLINNQNNGSQNNNQINYSGNYNNGNKVSMPYQYEQPSYYYSEKPWTMPTSNIMSSSSSSSSSGSTLSYPPWGTTSLPIQNGDNAPSTPSTRTREVLPSTSNILSSLGSANDSVSPLASKTTNSDSILNSIDGVTTDATSISQNDNERPRLPPVSQNQFFRANNNTLKSAVLPPLQYSSRPISNLRYDSKESNINNSNKESRSGCPKTMSSLGSTSTENRMNSGNNINKKSQLSPNNIPTSLDRQFSSNNNNVTILPSISAHMRSEKDTGNNIKGTNSSLVSPFN